MENAPPKDAPGKGENTLDSDGCDIDIVDAMLQLKEPQSSEYDSDTSTEIVSSVPKRRATKHWTEEELKALRKRLPSSAATRVKGWEKKKASSPTHPPSPENDTDSATAQERASRRHRRASAPLPAHPQTQKKSVPSKTGCDLKCWFEGKNMGTIPCYARGGGVCNIWCLTGGEAF
ncbi:hypothetical protein FA13DRAFT_1801701 [Coprinellus micaceus]|uniref:Uncharacterized protein n=1 Tax=Coprinellus micaceus TaxID=71717 RepID=A0A4Y7SDM9_COPMI|nr:hypothetical protein FA13DRAFT_1801701 [Coprinellus micaceus]